MVSAFFSKNAPNKPINGHACSVLEINKAHILILADGDDDKPCDWKAAQTAVEGFVECAKTLTHFDHITLVACAQSAQKRVEQIYGICKGANTSLSAAFVTENGVYHCLNIGNGAIFNYQAGGLTEIRQSDTIEQAHSGTLDEQQGLLLLSEGILKHPKYAFLPDLADWFSSTAPEQHSRILAQKYADGHNDDISAIMLKF